MHAQHSATMHKKLNWQEKIHKKQHLIFEFLNFINYLFHMYEFFSLLILHPAHSLSPSVKAEYFLTDIEIEYRDNAHTKIAS